MLDFDVGAARGIHISQTHLVEFDLQSTILNSTMSCFRLSRFASQQLTEGNPNIADLSDRNRPTKIGEMFGQLFDNEWSDAFDSLKKAAESSGGDGKQSVPFGKKSECTETNKDGNNQKRGGANSSVRGDKSEEGGAKSKVGGASDKDNALSKSSVIRTKSKTLGPTVQKEETQPIDGSKSLKSEQSSTQEWKFQLDENTSKQEDSKLSRKDARRSRTMEAGSSTGVSTSSEKINAPKEDANKANVTKEGLRSVATTNAATDSVKSKNAMEAASLLGEDVTDGGQGEGGGREMWGVVKGEEGAIAVVGEGEGVVVAVGEGAGATEEGEESEEEEEDFHVEQLTILQNIVMV